jgi:uncharacterized protein (DUF362 family)
MERRSFLQLAAIASAAGAGKAADGIPEYKVVTPFPRSEKPGMPGPYPGHVVRVRSEKCIDEATERIDVPTVREMISRGMTSLTGDSDARDSWRRFFSPSDTVGIKINSSGAPAVCSRPEVVTEICRELIGAGVKPGEIFIHERGARQMASIEYEKYVPEGVRIESSASYLGLDPDVFVDVDFFGEDDTRSFMLRMATQRFNKIINVPNMKDHGAAGVTGCLKNLAYGEFNNVGRSHYHAKTHTLSYIATLCDVEPLRSKAVLQIMDGLIGVWHAGPFSVDRRFRFYPKQMIFGTDPVAIDRLLIDVIDDKRKAEGAISVWDQSTDNYDSDRAKWENDPNINRFIRETGHIEYGTRFALGVYDLGRIDVKEIRIS